MPGQWKTWFKIIAVVLAIAVVSFPMAFIGTIFLIPLWEWLDNSTGIHAIGYHGPREWCYEVIHGAVALLGYVTLAVQLVGRRRRNRLASA